MCWSAEVSLITFISSAALCAYLWYRNLPNDRPIAIWIFWFSLMQLFEFFMWMNMKNHSLASKLSLISILLQPVVLATAILKYNTTIDNKWVKIMLYVLIAIGLFRALYAVYYAFYVEGNVNWLSVKGENCHLVWYFSRHPELPAIIKINQPWCYALLLTVLSISPTSLALIYGIFGVVAFNLTLLYYSRKELGSLWCWVCNIIPLIAVVVHPLL